MPPFMSQEPPGQGDSDLGRSRDRPAGEPGRALAGPAGPFKLAHQLEAGTKLVAEPHWQSLAVTGSSRAASGVRSLGPASALIKAGHWQPPSKGRVGSRPYLLRHLALCASASMVGSLVRSSNHSS